MKQESIAEAVTRFATQVRKYSALMARDTKQLPTYVEMVAYETNIRALCNELDALAQRSESGDIQFSDFDDIRSKLYAINAVAPLGSFNAVCSAFISDGRT